MNILLKISIRLHHMKWSYKVLWGIFERCFFLMETLLNNLSDANDYAQVVN